MLTTDRKNPTTNLLLAAIVILLVAGAIYVFNGGIRIGSSNHVGLMPVVRRILDPSYLPGDFNIQMRLFHHRVFAYVIAGAAWLFGEDRGVLFISVLGLLTLSAGIFALCRALKLPEWACLAAGLMIALRVMWANYGFEENTFIGNQEVQPPVFAHGLMLVAFAAVINKRYRLPAFLAGAALSLHLQIGVTFALLLAPFYLPKLKEFGIKESLRLAALALVPALPALWHASEMFARGVNSSAFTIDYVIFRMPHHFEPMSAAHVAWVAAHVTIQGVCYWTLRRMQRDESRAVGVLLAVSLTLVALALLHFADFYVLKIKTFVKPQFLRVSPLINVFGLLALITTAHVWASQQKQRATLVLQTACALIILGAVIYQVKKPEPAYAFTVQPYAKQQTSWVDLCRWVNANGPRDTVYATPPNRDGFTYLSNRSNIAEFKINPDGALYLKEWYERLTDLSGGKLPHERGLNNRKPLEKAYAALDNSQLLALGEKYHAGYAVLPKTSQANLPVIYQNKDYRIVKLSPPVGAAALPHGRAAAPTQFP